MKAQNLFWDFPDAPWDCPPLTQAMREEPEVIDVNCEQYPSGAGPSCCANLRRISRQNRIYRLENGYGKMRSVIVHLGDTTESEVAAYLSRTYLVRSGDDWILLSKNQPFLPDDYPILTISSYRDMNTEYEVEEYLALSDYFGGEPAVDVIAYVSGSVDGTREITDFACGLLRTFHGIVMDEHTPHLWTLAEIEANAKVSGHPFFDCRGWFEENERNGVF